MIFHYIIPWLGILVSNYLSFERLRNAGTVPYRDGILFGYFDSLRFQSISKGLAKLQVFASHPSRTDWLAVQYYLSLLRLKNAGTGHESLSRFLRYARNLLSVIDPGSLVRRGGTKPNLTDSLNLVAILFASSKISDKDLRKLSTLSHLTSLRLAVPAF